MLQPITCDSCRQQFARSQVDSIRLGNPVLGFWKTVALVVGIPALALYAACSWTKGSAPCGRD